MPLNILLSHCYNNVKNIDYDLFDAISRRIEIKYIGMDIRSVKKFEERNQESIEILRREYGNREIS